ncbi:unnamed protein product [Tilletia controversa]|uniref:Uncharacterized protein n=3 Tax=Tilletia TaxID=13289 RepID=A0A8X7MUF3_9BASI|nr:hypothetical protein A4X06_0g3227 [Tilletia controversa]CAD6887767.1 unnamed protein product [Tilletia caries]CAD6965732.1 unnamed protein product [Tilletia laevis]CAD6908744.1 unnamed protein product [Tilletia caries]CAD6937232.1 unnamed protein product [Tilletia caries]
MSSTRSIHEAACSATCAPATTGPGAPITYDPSSTSPRANSGDDSMDDSMSELLQQLSAALEPTASQACIARLNPATREVLSSAYYALKGFVDQGINMDWSGVQAALDHMTDEAAQDTVVNVLRQWFDTAAVCNLEDAFRKFLPNQGGVLEAPQPTTESTEAQKVNETNGDQDMDDEEGTDDGNGQGAVVLGESYTQNQSHSSPFGNELYQTQPALANTDANLYCGPLSASQVRSLLSKTISENARTSLTGRSTGYMQFYHFKGLVPVAETSDEHGGQEMWQCRICHKHYTTPTSKVSNLGTHLYGTEKRTGCLYRRGETSVERVILPTRNRDGKFARFSHNNKRKLRGPSSTASS